jgi:hypothetical protein
MDEKVFLIILLVLVFAFSFAGCSSASCISSAAGQSITTNIPIVDEVAAGTSDNSSDTNTVYSWSESDRIKFYPDLRSLSENAQFIFTGTCISSDPIFQNETLYTLSKVKISKGYKGNLKDGDIVSIIEMGGRTTIGEYSKNCIKDEKTFDTGEKLYPDDTKLVMGIDEYYPLSKDEEVLLFAGDTSGFLKDFAEPLYDIIGGYDGKFLLQKDGSYAKPKPSASDEHEFEDETFIITLDELSLIK